MHFKQLFLYILILCGFLSSCSPKQNTAASRQWQAFVTRYNVYYNASEAYNAGREAQQNGLRENFAQRLPLFSVGYENMRSLGKNNFETAITKCEKAIQLHSIKRKPKRNVNKTTSEREKVYLSRKEFNPFLKNAWLLMGRAQFQKGDFIAAASTFSYLTRFYAAQPEVVAEARVWLARCYAELNWFYDAEDALKRLERSPLSKRLSGELQLTMADFLIRQERLAEAVPYLTKAARQVPGSFHKARTYFLLSQVLMQTDRKAEAQRALKKCLRQNPSYEMAFQARILQTEAMTTPQSAASMVRRLRSMARDEKNKDFLDQVYYAMGNIELLRRDTTAALKAYETGRARATQARPEKGILLLKLGNLYWERRRMDKAQNCYTEAVGLLDKSREDYAQLTQRSKVLDELVPHTTTIFEQDSLLALAQLPEAERNAVIDRAIADYKKQQAQARKAQADSATHEQANENSADNAMPRPITTPRNAGQTRGWYFYNTQAVQQGKQAFVQQWGRRKNEDDWRRMNRSVVNVAQQNGVDYDAEEKLQQHIDALRDSLTAAGLSVKEVDRQLAEYTDFLRQGGDPKAAPTPLKTKGETPASDPLHRDFYLSKIPFSDEAKQQAHTLLQDALFQAGLIEKDKLEDLALAHETLTRLVRYYPRFEKLNEAYYHLFLLAKRRHRSADAERYRQFLAQHYPNYEMTRVVNDPEFERNSRYARELEDSLYAATYNAYVSGNAAAVAHNFARSTAAYPTGANRPKFMFINALSRLATAPRDTIAAELTRVATTYPKSDVAEMAGMIVRGLQSGRSIKGRSLDLGGLWTHRLSDAAAESAASGESRELKAEKKVPFVFLVAYPTDSLNDDAVLFALAKFNFSAFVSRGFDIVKERTPELTQFHVTGFQSYEDAHFYAQRLFRQHELAAMFRRARIELISEHNLKLLGAIYSFDDYRKFFDKHYAPLKINPKLPLEFEPPADEHPKQIYEDELPANGKPQSPANKTDTDEENTASDDAEYYDE